MEFQAFKAVYVEIGNICNLQCSFCPAVERKARTMTVGEFRDILDKVAPYTHSLFLHLMGEPLRHPELGELIDACQLKGVPVNITTNGVLLRKDKYSVLLNPVVRQINFSLHSFADNFPGIDPTAYVKKVFDFVSTARESRPDLYINFRLWDLDAQQTAKEENERIRHLVEAEYGCDLAALKIDIRRRKGYKIAERIYVHFDSRFVWPSLSAADNGSYGRCYGLIHQIGIHADGTVVPCCLDKEAVLALGNIHEQSLEDIVQSKRAVAIRKGFENGRLIEPMCQRCNFATRFSRRSPQKN